MKTELCLRVRAGDRIVGSVTLNGRVDLADAIASPEARAIAAAYMPHHARPFVAADYGCYWTRQDCR